MTPVSQVWQTPVRHAHRTGTSHASASSRRLWKAGAQRTFRPLRAKDTNGPTPADPAGWCGGRRGAAAMLGVLGGVEPKISVWMRLAATPQVPSSTARLFMKADGPHR